MLVLFDIRDDLGISEEGLEELIVHSSFHALCGGWKWVPRAHFDDIVINIPDPPEEDGDTSPD